MQLSVAADLLKGKLIGDDISFDSISINTRTLSVGDLYVAIKGLNFDGNEYVQEAKNKGAIGAIVEKKSEANLSQVLVENTKIALGQLAKFNRDQSTAIIAGITGSQGKTTVKEMVGKILSLTGNTLVTKGNLNNEIGVPLTLLEINGNHQFGVIEMGANHAGEISYSVGLVGPNVAAIVNAAKAHIEGFETLTGVAVAKGEIIDGVRADGTVVLNADDNFFESWKQRAGQKKVVSFSLQHPGADYYATDIKILSSRTLSFKLRAKDESRQVKLQLLGKHNVINAVAACAIAMEVGASIDQAVEGLGNIRPVKGRLCPVSGMNQGGLIDDSYNASPGSFRAAIDALAEFDGKRVLVMGDMGELGDESQIAHKEIGDYALHAGIDQLLGVGQFAAHSVDAFGEGAVHFASKNELIERCKEVMSFNTTLLIKGSRSAGMNEVVDALGAPQPDSNNKEIE